MMKILNTRESDRQMVINEKVNYLLKDHALVRHYRGLTHRQNTLKFGSLQELVDILEMSSGQKGKVALNGWEVEPVYYLEEDCWMNPEKAYEVHYYQIKDSQGGMIFPDSSDEIGRLREFLRQFL